MCTVSQTVVCNGERDACDRARRGTRHTHVCVAAIIPMFCFHDNWNACASKRIAITTWTGAHDGLLFLTAIETRACVCVRVCVRVTPLARARHVRVANIPNFSRKVWNWMFASARASGSRSQRGQLVGEAAWQVASGEACTHFVSAMGSPHPGSTPWTSFRPHPEEYK